MSNMLDAGPEIKSNKWHKLQAILCIIAAIVIIMMVFKHNGYECSRVECSYLFFVNFLIIGLILGFV